jgi:hypothetical protein
VRPALRAGLLPVWRDSDTIQIGVDPRRAVALTGASPAARLIGLLDGSRDREQLLAAAAELDVPRPLAEQMLTLLAAAGLLIDYPARLLRGLPDDTRARLLPELAAASIARQDSDGGALVLTRRAAAVVHVLGAGQLAAGIAEILTASGVQTARPAPGQDPAGRGPAPPGRRTPSSGRGPVSAGRGPVSSGRGTPPAAVVLAGQLPDPAAPLLRTPHLAVSAREAIGIVGPLVRPGSSACLRCLDLARADCDSAWPLILAQIARREAEPVACDAALAAAVTAQAAAQVLAFIDWPDRVSPACNATLELVQPGWQWVRRSWPPHPACTCRASDGYGDGHGRDPDRP